MGTVVKLAVVCVGRDVGHGTCQLHRLNVVQTKLLKTRAID